MPKKLFLSGSDQQREPENREPLRARASISRNLKHLMPRSSSFQDRISKESLKTRTVVSSSFDWQKPEASHVKKLFLSGSRA
jgi:hypothetical protein